MPEIAEKNGSNRGLSRALAGIALAAALLTAGCSLDYSQALAEEQAAENVPDTVAVDLLHKVHRDGQLSIELSAARAETYNAKNETILTDARFVEYDANGKPATEGQAGSVVFHTDTENAEISGGVRVHSASEQGDVTANALSCVNKDRQHTAPPEEQVIIRKDDGSSISGSGFRGDFKTRQLIFSGPVQGTYVFEQK